MNVGQNGFVENIDSTTNSWLFDVDRSVFFSEFFLPGRGRMLVLDGPSSIGKTMLAQAFGCDRTLVQNAFRALVENALHRHPKNQQTTEKVETKDTIKIRRFESWLMQLSMMMMVQRIAR